MSFLCYKTNWDMRGNRLFFKEREGTESKALKTENTAFM